METDIPKANILNLQRQRPILNSSCNFMQHRLNLTIVIYLENTISS